MMDIKSGDKVSLSGYVIEMGEFEAQIKVNENLVVVPVNSLTFVSRKVDNVTITKDELEKLLYKWDYSQTQTIESVWDYLCETSRL
jgi:hypothetical protein